MAPVESAAKIGRGRAFPHYNLDGRDLRICEFEEGICNLAVLCIIILVSTPNTDVAIMGKKSKKHGNRQSANDFFQYAQRAMEKQDFKEALKNAKVCFRQDPSHEHRQILERSWLARGLQLARAGLQTEGRAAAQELLAMGVSQPDVQQGLPELLLAVGLYDQAVTSGKIPGDAAGGRPCRSGPCRRSGRGRPGIGAGVAGGNSRGGGDGSRGPGRARCGRRGCGPGRFGRRAPQFALRRVEALRPRPGGLLSSR